MHNNQYDVIVVGGGQSGLALGYYLNKSKLKYLIVDNQNKPGGAWNNTWESLHLFSPAESSSLPGWQMPKTKNQFPHKSEVLDYLCKYEERYKLEILRPRQVVKIEKKENGFIVKTDEEELETKAVVMSTGTWTNKYIPEYESLSNFKGFSIHSGDYKSAVPYSDKKILIVGGGNSGAQIAAELLQVADVIWSCEKPPQFLPPDIDGKDLFDIATSQYRKKAAGIEVKRDRLGDIVQVPQVKRALESDLFDVRGLITEFTEDSVIFENGDQETIDGIIWCTGFKPALESINDLRGCESNRLKTNGSKATLCEGLWAVGYGNWTGFASATLIGVGRTAKKTVNEIKQYIDSLEAT